MRKSILLFTLVALLATAGTMAVEREWTASSPAIIPLGSVPADLLFEGFEDNFPPDGWTSMTSGEAFPWTQSDLQAFDGTYSAYVQWGETGFWQDEWLVTEVVDTTGMGTLYLEFYETGGYWTSYGVSHEILVSTTVPNDPGAFTSVLSMTPASYPADWLDNPGTWNRFELDLSAYVGITTVYVALRYQGEYADDWWVDNFRLYEPYDHDVAAEEVRPDGEIWTSGTDIVPQLVVRNTGLNTETFDVRMVIDLDESTFYTETATVTGLMPGEESTVDFPSFTSEVGIYELSADTMLSGDEDSSNNSADATNSCYSGQRTPLGMLVTNWGCGPCVQANQALDEYHPAQGNDVALIRVHAWWPVSDDPMYLANTEQCDHLINNTPTGADYAPHLWMDNFVDAGSDGAGYEGYFENQKLVGAPLTMEISYSADPSEATVTIEVLDPMPDGDFVLYVAVTEDSVDQQGPNGEPSHNQVFRYVYPDLMGTLISTAIGTEQYVVPLALDPSWEFINLRVTAWVQDPDPVGVVMNAATMFMDPMRNLKLVTGPGPAETNPPLVRVFLPTQAPEYLNEISAYGPSKYGANVTCGDVTGDGIEEILTGAGPGAIYGPHVRGWNHWGTSMSDLSFLAYGTSKWGVNVAAGDIDGDGYDEIITGAGPGEVFGPHVRAWNYDGGPDVTQAPGISYFAYGTPKWGVNVSTGDIDGDGYDEIVTGAGPGAVYGPHVRGWDVDGGTEVAKIPNVSFLAYGTNKHGVNVTCGDVDGDGIDEMITGPGPSSFFPAHVRGWDYDGSTLTPMNDISFFAWSPDNVRFGANVFAGTDLNNDGRDELIVGAGPDGNASTPVKIYTYDGQACTEWVAFEAYSDMMLTQGVNVAAMKN